MTISSYPVEIIDRLKEIVGVLNYIEDTSYTVQIACRDKTHEID